MLLILWHCQGQAWMAVWNWQFHTAYPAETCILNKFLCLICRFGFLIEPPTYTIQPPKATPNEHKLSKNWMQLPVMLLLVTSQNQIVMPKFPLHRSSRTFYRSSSNTIISLPPLSLLYPLLKGYKRVVCLLEYL